VLVPTQGVFGSEHRTFEAQAKGGAVHKEKAQGLRKTRFGVFFVIATLGSLTDLIASLAPKIRCRGFW